MYEETDYFEAMNGRRFLFVGMKDPATLIVWEHRGTDHGWRTERLGALDVHSIEISTLKKHNLWDSLTPEVQQEITNGVVEEKKAVVELMAKARMSRKQKYANVPRELICPKCSGKKVVSPGALVKQADETSKEKKIIYTVQDLIRDYVCKACKKVVDPELVNLPDKLVCKCGYTTRAVAGQLKDRAVRLGCSVKEVIENYKCQSCFPSKGRKKKGG